MNEIAITLTWKLLLWIAVPIGTIFLAMKAAIVKLYLDGKKKDKIIYRLQKENSDDLKEAYEKLLEKEAADEPPKPE